MAGHPQIDDPRFHAWVKRRDRTIKAGTPFGEVLELFMQWIYELGDEQRARDAALASVQAERRAMLNRLTDARLGFRRPTAPADDLPARVAAGWTRGDPELRRLAHEAVNNAVPLSRWLHHSHGADNPVDRWTYMRHYFVALNALGGTPVTEEQLLDQVVQQERRYLERLRQQGESAARSASPGLQRAALLRWARGLPLNPVDDFEPGIAFFDVESAWRRKDSMDYGASVEIDGYQTTVSYPDGKSLSFSSKVLDFTGEDIRTTLAAFVRRHRRTGRLVMFAVHQPDALVYRGLPVLDALGPDDRVYLGVPFLLTPVVHARFTRDPLYDIALGILGVLKVMSIGKALPVGTRILSAGLSTTARVGTGLFAAGRSAVYEVSFAVSRYGLSTQAATWVGRSAWTYYLANAVTINTHVVVGAEIALGFAGQDMGPLSLGDSLTLATQIDDAARAGRRTWQAITAEVVEIEAAGNVARLKTSKVEQITEDVARAEYDSGRKVLATKPGASRAARGVDDQATAARGIVVPEPPVVPSGAVAQGKRAARLPAAVKGAPVLTQELNRAKAALVDGLGRFPSLKGKYTQAALDAISGISPDAIRAAGIHPDDLAKLAAGLARAGPSVRSFVNGYHAVPGFDQVLLNWARRSYWNSRARKPGWVASKASYVGASYLMKYVTGKKLPPAALRFEWPASINDTRAGSEVVARWVDIVYSEGQHLRPGATIQIELKSWTEAMLRIKTRAPAGQSTTYPGTVGYQLIRDTALFSPENIRWVFDASKGVTKAQVIGAFERVIAGDPYLLSRWGGKDRNVQTVRELLDDVIEVF